MENFVLYDEVGRGDHSVVYKGRRKGTINFVAIHCVDKCKRPHVTNLVRLTHEIEHENVVKFYEWYETTNHLWLVVELCTGGSLATVISQDEHLPESSVRKFGIDLVKGLHHIHSLGIIFSDLKPSKVLLDGPGVLKFANFGLSRVEGESLEELFEQFADAGEMWGSSEQESENSEGNLKEGIPKHVKALGTPRYLAPEVLQGRHHSLFSDLWSLGIVLYEMFTGHPTFLADTYEQLVEKIINKPVPVPKVKGSRVSGKPSPEFQTLLSGLLEKDPSKRTGWAGLVSHPFWQEELQHLAIDLETESEARQSVRQSIANFSARASVTSELPKGNSVLGHIHGVDLNNDQVDALSEKMTEDMSTMTITERPESTMSMRPLTAPGSGDIKVSFTLSSRPHTAATEIDEHISPPKTLTQSPLNVKETLRKAKQEMTEERGDMSSLIYHTSDFTLTPIVDNPKIQKPSSMKFDPKTLLVPPLPAEKILSLPERDQEKHISSLCDAVAVPEKGPPSQKRMQLLYYSASIGANSAIANMLVNQGILSSLAKHVKDAQHVEIKAKLCRILGIIANNTTELDPETHINEVTSVLTEIMRENFRNGKVKAAILPALGEIVYLAASQEEIKGHGIDTWQIATMTYTLIIRCLREGEEAIVNHYAAKIIENVASTTGTHSQKFAINEVGQLLWYVFTHATADAVRITALSALSRLAKHAVGVFQSVIEKVGLPKMLSTMSLPINRIQQSVVTMFASLIISDARLTRVIQDKEFTQHIMRLLESPSVVIRGKAFLVILEVIKNNQEMLLVCCQNRLVMYVERDTRRQTLGKAENQSQIDYLGRCLDLLVSVLIDMVPAISGEILTALEAVTGRKHPSTIQIRQLKHSLPLMPVIQHLISSTIFRPKIVSEKFMKNLGTLLVHVQSIDAGATQIHSATGASGTEEFIHSIFAVLEAIAKHPNLLTDYHSLVIEKILPSLASLVNSSAGDTRSLSLRLFSEIASIYLNQEMYDTTKHKTETKQLHHIILNKLLPQYEQLLLEQDPLPFYALKLLLSVLEQNPSFIRDFERANLMPVFFQSITDHQSNPISNTMQQIGGVLNCLVSHKETNVKDLYDHGLVDYLTNLFVEVTAICINSEHTTDMKSAIAMLLCLLDTIHGTLKFVSDVVRKALQAKKGGGEGGNREAEMAEALLLTNKSFTDLMSLLTQLLNYEDSDISDVSLKCLSLLVQLFGGEHPDAMSPENMVCYSSALQKADAKKQKVILRIIKRMISTEKGHGEMLRLHGKQLTETIKGLVQSASNTAEVALSTLAAEILKTSGHPT